MPIIYGSSKIIPAPLVNISEEISAAPDGRKVGSLYVLTLTGTIVSDMGSPQDGTLGGAGWGGPSNLFWTSTGYPSNESINVGSKQNAIQIKQNALRALFSVDGQWLQFQSPNGDAPLKCQPRLRSIQFQEGIWVQTCAYTIILEADILYLNGAPVDNTPDHSELINSASENWQIQEGEVKKTYAVTHTLSAVGKRSFDSTGTESGYPWQHARDFVYNRLGLGFTGVGNFSTIPVSTLVNNSSLASGSINFTNLLPHNFSRNESIDEIGGSYSLTENWLLCATSGSDNYTINVRRIVDEPFATVMVGIQGQIQGYYDQLFDYDTKIKSAQWMWNQLQGASLYNRVAAYATGVNLNQHATEATLDIDAVNGTITYNYAYDNKPYNNDVLDSYVISKKNTPDDYKITYAVNGTIKGRRYESDASPFDPYNRAISYFNSIDPETYYFNKITSSLHFSDAGSGLQPNPYSRNIDQDEANGTITYSYEFNTRLNDNNINSAFVQEDYNISSSFDATQGRKTYSVQGTILGLSIANIDRETRFTNAVNYWEGVAQPALYSRIQSYYPGVNLDNQNAVATEIQKNKNAGTITYNYTYNNIPRPLLPGALWENITVSEQNANRSIQTVAIIPIVGKSTGPIIQQINTTPQRTRSVNVEVVLQPTGSVDFVSSLALKPNYDSYILPLAPNGGYLQEDSEQWGWREGRYSRSVSWVY